MVWRVIFLSPVLAFFCLCGDVILPAVAANLQDDVTQVAITDADIGAISDAVVDGVVDAITPSEDEVAAAEEAAAAAAVDAAVAEQERIDAQTGVIGGQIDEATETILEGLVDAQQAIVSGQQDFEAVGSAGDGITTYDFTGSVGSPYAGTISSTILDIFDRLSVRVAYGYDYVMFRGSQYDYYLFAGDVVLDGDKFIGQGLDCWHLYTGQYNNAGYDVSFLSGLSLRLSVSADDLVYSSIAPYPVLGNDTSDSFYSLVGLFIAAVVAISVIIWRVFAFVLRYPRYVGRRVNV